MKTQAPSIGRKEGCSPLESAEQACGRRLLTLPRVSLKGTQVGDPDQSSRGTWGWVATAQSAHVREPGKMVLEELGRGRQNSMYFALCLNLKHSFKLLSILEWHKHLGHCSWEQKDTWGKDLQEKCHEREASDPCDLIASFRVLNHPWSTPAGLCLLLTRVWLPSSQSYVTGTQSYIGRCSLSAY